MSRFILREAGSDGDSHEDSNEEDSDELEREKIWSDESENNSGVEKSKPLRTRTSSQDSDEGSEHIQIETLPSTPTLLQTASTPPTPSKASAKPTSREKKTRPPPHEGSRANHKKEPDVTKIINQRVPQILMAGELVYDFYSINFDYRKTKLVNLTQLWRNYPPIFEKVVKHLKLDKDILCFFLKLETNEGKKGEKKQKVAEQAAATAPPAIPPVYQTRVVDGKTVAEAVPIRQKKRRKASLAEQIQGHMNNGQALEKDPDDEEDEDEEDPYAEPADAPEPMQTSAPDAVQPPQAPGTEPPALTNTMRGRWHMHIIVYRPRVSVPPYNPENFRKLLSMWFGASRVDAHIVTNTDHLTAKKSKELDDKMSGGLSYTLKGVPCTLTTYWWQKIHGNSHELARWTRWVEAPDGSNKRLESVFAPHPLPTFFRGALWGHERHKHACHEFEQLIAALHRLIRPTVKDGDYDAIGAENAPPRTLPELSANFSPLPVPATTGRWAKLRADKQAMMTLLERYGFVYGVENSCLYRRRKGTLYCVENFGALDSWTLLVDKFALLFTTEEWVTFEDIVTRYEWPKIALWFPLMRELKRYRRYAAWDFVELKDHSILCLSTGKLLISELERAEWLREQQDQPSVERARSGGFACHFDSEVDSNSIKQLPLNWLKLLKDMPKISVATYSTTLTGESFKWQRLLIHLANLNCYRYTKQPVPFLWGDADCGKSTLLSPWTKLYRGHANADNYSAIAEISRSESAPLSQLTAGEPRLLLCLEYSATRLKDDEEKDLLEGGTIAVRRLHKDPVIRANRCAMFFASQAEPDPEKKLSRASREALVSARYELFHATHKLTPDNAKRLAIEAEYLNVHYYLSRLRNEPELRRVVFEDEADISPLPPRPSAAATNASGPPNNAPHPGARGSSYIRAPTTPLDPLS